MFRQFVIVIFFFFISSFVVHSLPEIKINEIGIGNVRNNVRVMLRLELMGLHLCIKECQRVNFCDAVNYKRSSLQCELVAEDPQSSELETSDGWRYISKTEMQQVRKDIYVVLICSFRKYYY